VLVEAELVEVVVGVVQILDIALEFQDIEFLDIVLGCLGTLGFLETVVVLGVLDIVVVLGVLDIVAESPEIQIDSLNCRKQTLRRVFCRISGPGETWGWCWRGTWKHFVHQNPTAVYPLSVDLPAADPASRAHFPQACKLQPQQPL